MGTEYYLIDDARREYFCLGKGGWYSHPPSEDLGWLDSRESILAFLISKWAVHFTGLKNDMNIEYCLYLRDKLWDFRQGRVLRLETDFRSFDERYGTPESDEMMNGNYENAYAYVDSRYAPNNEHMEYVNEHYGPGLSDVWEILHI